MGRRLRRGDRGAANWWAPSSANGAPTIARLTATTTGGARRWDTHIIAFRLDREGFDAARAALGRMGVAAHCSDHGISHSIYLRDPEGHQIELTTYDV
ncbi:MAG: hypothetical protein H0W08_03415 [Acidobacteria bacterium]|nr:hypothetical protein [Acidobacteriota bacterium]